MARIYLGDTEVTGAIYERLIEVMNQWHERHREDFKRGGNYPEALKNFDERDEKRAHVGQKYIRIDTGTSGAWMLEQLTGDIYGIHGYGKVDRKKIAGNINDPDFNGATLFTDRFRRGRFDNRKLTVKS